jgi:hypothetical protein
MDDNGGNKSELAKSEGKLGLNPSKVNLRCKREKLGGCGIRFELADPGSEALPKHACNSEKRQ